MVCLKICISGAILNKSENIINAEYWVLSENRKNYFSASKNQSVLIAKIKLILTKHKKIANPQK